MKLVELGEVCEVIAGQSPPSSTYNQEKKGLPFFQGKADFGNLYPTVRYWCTKPKKIAKPNDILFSVRAPVGSTNINNIEASIGRGLSAIRCGNNVDLKFLLYYLRGNEKRIADLGTGSTFKAITIKTLKALKIPLFPLSEQKRIAHLLDQADKLRQLNKKLIEKYDELAQSVFLEMFGDPVINPKEWEKKLLEAVCDKISVGFVGKCEPFYCPENKGVPMLRTGNLGEGVLKKDNLKYVTYDFHNKQKKSQLFKNDILIARHGDNGKAVLYEGDFLEANCLNIVVLRPNKKLKSIYVQYLLNSTNTRRKIEGRTGGATQKIVNTKEIKKLDVPVPPLSLQTEFANRVTLIEQQKDNVKQALQKSEDLFNCLLQKAFKS